MDNEKRLLKLEFEQGETTKKLDQIIRTQEDRVGVFYNKFAIYEKQVSSDIEKSRESLKNELIGLGKTYVYVTSFFISMLGALSGYLYLEIKNDTNLIAGHIIEIVEKIQSNKSD